MNKLCCIFKDDTDVNLPPDYEDDYAIGFRALQTSEVLPILFHSLFSKNAVCKGRPSWDVNTYSAKHFP